MVRIHCNKTLQKLINVFAIMGRYFRVNALKNLLEEAIHVLSSKGRLQSCDLIEHTAERPDVALAIIGLIFPYLGACIVRSTCLCIEQASWSFRNF
jgi:hypothetical protein